MCAHLSLGVTCVPQPSNTRPNGRTLLTPTGCVYVPVMYILQQFLAPCAVHATLYIGPGLLATGNETLRETARRCTEQITKSVSVKMTCVHVSLSLCLSLSVCVCVCVCAIERPKSAVYVQYIFRISVLGVSWTSWGYKISGRHDWS